MHTWYLSLLVRCRVIQPCEMYAKKCVHLRQKLSRNKTAQLCTWYFDWCTCCLWHWDGVFVKFGNFIAKNSRFCLYKLWINFEKDSPLLRSLIAKKYAYLKNYASIPPFPKGFMIYNNDKGQWWGWWRCKW